MPDPLAPRPAPARTPPLPVVSVTLHDAPPLRSRSMPAPPPGPLTPLAGLTILAVEDSRFASDALRLMAHRSGARLRRAESLTAAQAHLRLYRPDVVLVDLGLPDGCGTDLVARLAARGPGRPVLIGTSGHDGAEEAMRRAGADGFLAKPVASLAWFEEVVLIHFPDRAWLRGLPARDGLSAPAPDPLALHDDLSAAARRLAADPDEGEGRYLAGFVAGLARAAGDPGLEAAADAAGGQPQALGALARALAERLAILRDADLVAGRGQGAPG